VTLAARFDTAARGLVHTLRRLLVP
jgi:hypothetical protein